MHLEEKYKQLYRLLDVVVKEAIWDYSSHFDMSVVNINGQPLIFDKSQLNMLNEIKQQVEKEM